METDKGTIEFELLAKDSPTAVENFRLLAERGYYKGVTFHRIVKGFMIQAAILTELDWEARAHGAAPSQTRSIPTQPSTKEVIVAACWLWPTPGQTRTAASSL